MGAEEELPLYRAALMLWKVIPPMFLVFGIFGNILTLMVLTKRRLRKSPTSLFLAALALSDILALLTGLFRQWVKYTFDFDIRTDISEFGCKLHWFVVYVVTQFSSWMLIFITVERVISTWLPHIRVVAFRFKTAVIAISVMTAFLLLLNVHFFYGYGSLEVTTGNTTYTERCTPLTPGYNHFVIYQWTWIDLCVFYLIPMIVLLVGNSAVMYKVIQSRRRCRRGISLVAMKVHATSASGSVAETSHIKAKRKKAKRISSLTITLILISAVFIICITPIVVYPIGEPYWSGGADLDKLAELFFWECFSNLIMYVNNTVNFLLYFLSGTRFRNEVKKLFCRNVNQRDESRSLSTVTRPTTT